MPGLAGPDPEPDREVGLAGAGRAEEHHVLFGGDEVQGAQVGDDVAFEAAGVVEVELLEALAGREPGGADAALAAVGLPGGDLPLQAGDQELLVAPGLGAGAIGQPGTDSRRVGALSARVRNATSAVRSRLVCGLRGRGGHHATPPSVSSRWPLELAVGEPVGDAEGGVVVVQAADLHLRFGSRVAAPGPAGCAAASPAARCSGSEIVWCQAQIRS